MYTLVSYTPHDLHYSAKYSCLFDYLWIFIITSKLTSLRVTYFKRDDTIVLL